MRLIDADKIYVIPAEDDNITGMGMTREEQDAYNEGVDAVMEKIKNAKTVDPYEDVLDIINEEQEEYRTAYEALTNVYNRVFALRGEQE